LVKKIEDTTKKEMLIKYNKRYTMQSMSLDNLITQLNEKICLCAILMTNKRYTMQSMSLDNLITQTSKREDLLVCNFND
jgi:hypothetical protein